MPWTKREFEREIGLPVNVVVKRLDAKDFDFDGFTICCVLSFLGLLFDYYELIFNSCNRLLRC